MSNYNQVSDALKSGADPKMLCLTCQWDRNCINPPSMTRAEIDRQVNEANLQDKAAAAADPSKSMPVGTLIAALTLGGRDTSAQLCPVLALQLRLPEGKAVVETIKAHMQNAGSTE